MEETLWREIVLATITQLPEHGYTLEVTETPEMLDFAKMLAPGVRAWIRFTLIPNFDAPHEFSVALVRYPSEDKADPVGYTHVGASLPSLMLRYGQHIYPPRYMWPFIDNKSLVRELEDAQTLLVEYGIPWLEDPETTMDYRSKPIPKGDDS